MVECRYKKLPTSPFILGAAFVENNSAEGSLRQVSLLTGLVSRCKIRLNIIAD
jgi:hypothetical protein